MPEREQPDLSRVDAGSNTFPGVKDELQRALGTNQYETAKDALGKADSLLSWRQAERRSPFPQFYELIEGAAVLNKPGVTATAHSEMVDQLIGRARSMSPRVRDLYLGLLSDLDKTPYLPQFEITGRQLESLTTAGDLDLLTDPSVSWDLKLNRMETRIESELKGRRALDKIDERKKDDEEQRDIPQQNTPPPDSEESKPGMDEMERLKEGESAPAIWEVSPAYGGYFKEQSFDVWDPQRNTWTKSSSKRTAANLPRGIDATHALTAILPPNQWTRIPLPYKFRVNTLGNDPVLQLAKDENGDMVIFNSGSSGKDVAVGLTKKEPKDIVNNPPAKPLEMSSNLSSETEDFLEQIRNSGKTALQKARSLASYTMRRLQYSNDSSYNTLYENHQAGYVGAIDQFKKADCDVANTYFAALCAQLDIPARHVVGHMVKGKNENGNSAITSGTGHAWTEVWDNQKSKWVRIDATPPGDPQQQEDKQEGENVPGDYPEQEAIRPTDEELQDLREQLSQLTESLSYTKEEREMSEAAGVELKDARQIIKEIKEADETKLPSGEKVVDVMSKLWELIRESRTIKSSDYTGPVRRREGGEGIDDIVSHAIGIKAGDPDPASREREYERESVEQIIREMQLRAVFDKSGSMNQTVDDETKLAIQRRAGYLVFSSLYRAEQNMQKAANRMLEPLAIQSQAISFRDSNVIDEDKPLSNTFTLSDKVKLWKSLGDQGMGNGDVAALELYRDQIKEERDADEAGGKIDDALRIIIVCSDGMPDDPAGVKRLAGELGEMNSVVVGIGMTETAQQVPIIFDTPHSKGDLAEDINDLPAIFAKHVVGEAIKLFPEKTRGQYQKSIDAILAKFDRVGVR